MFNVVLDLQREEDWRERVSVRLQGAAAASAARTNQSSLVAPLTASLNLCRTSAHSNDDLNFNYMYDAS